MELRKVTAKAIEQYRSTVKGNENTPIDQVIKKLTRNVELVKRKAEEQLALKSMLIEKKFFTTTYKYGNLHIVTRFGKVVECINHPGLSVGINFSKKLYQQLTKELGIREDKYKPKKAVHK